MRVPLAAAAILATAVWPNEVRSTLVSAASVLTEALPFVLAGVLAERVFRRRAALVAYAGCGCAAGPSARSLPAAALTWLAFGPSCAIARVTAAAIVDRLLRRARKRTDCEHGAPDFADALERLVPFAVAAAAAAQVAASIDVSHVHPALQIAVGVALGVFSSPCAIGSVAVASALHVRTAATATAFLCVAGIVDLHSLAGDRTHHRNPGDALAYGVLAIGAALVALRNGAMLVRPSLAPVLIACALVAAAFAIARRGTHTRRRHYAPALVLLGALIAAPPPVYRATETTLAAIFPGERLSFTGTLTRERNDAALIRYAITCCRADAAPVVVRLLHTPRLAPGTWAKADGTVVETASGFALSAERVTPVPAPADPFLYR